MTVQENEEKDEEKKRERKRGRRRIYNWNYLLFHNHTFLEQPVRDYESEWHF